MIIDCISDLHGNCPKLDGGDLLLIAGDIMARERVKEWDSFFKWLNKQDYEKKILVGGNHDNYLVNNKLAVEEEAGFTYLCDNGTEYKGLKIWGSPWTKWFYGVNPECRAFMDDVGELSKKFNRIPPDTDILVTHSPPLWILDEDVEGNSLGSEELTYNSPRNLKIHCFGHIHNRSEKAYIGEPTIYINASLVSQEYEQIINCVRVELNSEKECKSISIKIS